MPPSPAPSTRPTPPLTAQPLAQFCILMGANPNPKSAPEGPFPRGLARQRWVLGTPEPQRQTHTAARPPHGPNGRHLSFRVGERAGPSEPPSTFECPLCQYPWAMPPLHSDLNSSCPSARHTALSWGLRASWGLSLTLGQPRGSLPKEPGATTLGIGDTRTSMTDSAFLQPITLAQQDAAAHSVWENGQGPASPQQPSNAPHAKALGPMLPLPSGLTSVRPAATSTAVG